MVVDDNGLRHQPGGTIENSREMFGCGGDGWQWLVAAGEGNKVVGGRG